MIYTMDVFHLQPGHKTPLISSVVAVATQAVGKYF